MLASFSKGDIEPDLRFEVVDRIVLDDGNADFERKRSIISEFATDPRVEGKKQPAGLSGDRIAEIDPDVGARKQREEPFVRKPDVKGRRYLQVADVLFGRVAGETHIISNDRFQIARRVDLGQRHTKAGAGHELPFT